MPDGLDSYLDQFVPSKKLDVPSIADDEFSKLGYTDAARASLLGNIGRENGWNPDTIFSGHTDQANKKYNRGLISWQGDRRNALNDYLQQNGGDWTPNENNLRLQARFLDNELQTKYPKLYSRVKNAGDTATASNALQHYIGYSPKAPYNSPDPEYAVVNNRTWAQKALSRGLAQGGLSNYLDQFVGGQQPPAVTPGQTPAAPVQDVASPALSPPVQTTPAPAQEPAVMDPAKASAAINALVPPAAKPGQRVAPGQKPAIAAQPPAYKFNQADLDAANEYQRQQGQPELTPEQFMAAQAPSQGSGVGVGGAVTNIGQGVKDVATGLDASGQVINPLNHLAPTDWQNSPRELSDAELMKTQERGQFEIPADSKNPELDAQKLFYHALQEKYPELTPDKFKEFIKGAWQSDQPFSAGQQVGLYVNRGALKNLIGEAAVKQAYVQERTPVQDWLRGQPPPKSVISDAKADEIGLTPGTAIRNLINTPLETGLGDTVNSYVNTLAEPWRYVNRNAVAGLLAGGAATAGAFEGGFKYLGDLSDQMDDWDDQANKQAPGTTSHSGGDLFRKMGGFFELGRGAAQDIGKIGTDDWVGHFIQGIAELPSFELRMAMLPGGSVAKFATDAALQARGANKSTAEQIKAAAENAILAHISGKIAPTVGKLAESSFVTHLVDREAAPWLRKGVELATVPVAVAASSRAFGHNWNEAISSAGTMAAFHVAHLVGPEKANGLVVETRDPSNGLSIKVKIEDGKVKLADPAATSDVKVMVPMNQAQRRATTEIPGTEATPQQTKYGSQIDEIRANEADTPAKIQELYPHLSDSEAVDLHKQAWEGYVPPGKEAPVTTPAPAEEPETPAPKQGETVQQYIKRRIAENEAAGGNLKVQDFREEYKASPPEPAPEVPREPTPIDPKDVAATTADLTSRVGETPTAIDDHVAELNKRLDALKGPDGTAPEGKPREQYKAIVQAIKALGKKKARTPEQIAASYHDAISKGDNPELVKAVDHILGKREPYTAETTGTDAEGHPWTTETKEGKDGTRTTKYSATRGGSTVRGRSMSWPDFVKEFNPSAEEIAKVKDPDHVIVHTLTEKPGEDGAINRTAEVQVRSKDGDVNSHDLALEPGEGKPPAETAAETPPAETTPEPEVEPGNRIETPDREAGIFVEADQKSQDILKSLAENGPMSTLDLGKLHKMGPKKTLDTLNTLYKAGRIERLAKNRVRIIPDAEISDHFEEPAKTAEPKPAETAAETSDKAATQETTTGETKKEEPPAKTETKPPPPVNEKPPRFRKDWGASNRVVTNDQYPDVREAFFRELRKTFNTPSGALGPGGIPNLDLELIKAGTKLAAYHIEAGARKFADFSKAMIDDVGEGVRPYLKTLYAATKKEYPQLLKLPAPKYTDALPPASEVYEGKTVIHPNSKEKLTFTGEVNQNGNLLATNEFGRERSVSKSDADKWLGEQKPPETTPADESKKSAADLEKERQEEQKAKTSEEEEADIEHQLSQIAKGGESTEGGQATPIKPQGPSLVQVVRKAGGIRPVKDDSGEARRLSNRETGSSGIINKNAEMTAAEMAEHLWQRGYLRDIWPELSDVNGDQLLAAIEEDLFHHKAHGVGVHFSHETINDMMDAFDEEIGKQHEEYHKARDEAYAKAGDMFADPEAAPILDKFAKDRNLYSENRIGEPANEEAAQLKDLFDKHDIPINFRNAILDAWPLGKTQVEAEPATVSEPGKGISPDHTGTDERGTEPTTDAEAEAEARAIREGNVDEGDISFDPAEFEGEQKSALSPEEIKNVQDLREKGQSDQQIAGTMKVPLEHVEAVPELPEKGVWGKIGNLVMRAFEFGKGTPEDIKGDKTKMVKQLLKLFPDIEPLPDNPTAADINSKLRAIFSTKIPAEMGKERSTHMSPGDWRDWLKNNEAKLKQYPGARLSIEHAINEAEAFYEEQFNKFTDHDEFHNWVHDMEQKYGDETGAAFEKYETFDSLPNKDFRGRLIALAKEHGISKTFIDRAYSQARRAFQASLQERPDESTGSQPGTSQEEQPQTGSGKAEELTSETPTKTEEPKPETQTGEEAAPESKREAERKAKEAKKAARKKKFAEGAAASRAAKAKAAAEKAAAAATGGVHDWASDLGKVLRANSDAVIVSTDGDRLIPAEGIIPGQTGVDVTHEKSGGSGSVGWGGIDKVVDKDGNTLWENPNPIARQRVQAAAPVAEPPKEETKTEVPPAPKAPPKPKGPPTGQFAKGKTIAVTEPVSGKYGASLKPGVKYKVESITPTETQFKGDDGKNVFVSNKTLRTAGERVGEVGRKEAIEKPEFRPTIGTVIEPTTQNEAEAAFRALQKKNPNTEYRIRKEGKEFTIVNQTALDAVLKGSGDPGRLSESPDQHVLFNQEDLFGGDLFEKKPEQTSIFDLPGTETKPTPLTNEQKAAGSPTADYVGSLTKSGDSQVAKAAKELSGQTKYAKVNPGIDRAINDAADALDIFARARQTKSTVDDMLQQGWLGEKPVISERARSLAQAMENGEFPKALKYELANAKPFHAADPLTVDDEFTFNHITSLEKAALKLQYDVQFKKMPDTELMAHIESTPHAEHNLLKVDLGGLIYFNKAMQHKGLEAEFNGIQAGRQGADGLRKDIETSMAVAKHLKDEYAVTRMAELLKNFDKARAKDGRIAIAFSDPEHYPLMSEYTPQEEVKHLRDQQLMDRYPTLLTSPELRQMDGYDEAAAKLEKRGYHPSKIETEVHGKLGRDDAAAELGISEDQVTAMRNTQDEHLYNLGVTKAEYEESYANISKSLAKRAEAYKSTDVPESVLADAGSDVAETGVDNQPGAGGGGEVQQSAGDQPGAETAGGTKPGPDTGSVQQGGSADTGGGATGGDLAEAEAKKIDARKKQIEKQIDKLTKAITSKTPIDITGKPKVTSPEIERMIENRNKLQEQYDEMFPGTEDVQKKLDAREKSLNRQIAGIEEEIANKKLAEKKTKTPLTSEKIEELKAKRDELKRKRATAIRSAEFLAEVPGGATPEQAAELQSHFDELERLSADHSDVTGNHTLEYFQQLRKTREYIQSLQPTGALARAAATFRNSMLSAPHIPIKVTAETTLNRAIEEAVKAVAYRGKGANSEQAYAYTKEAREIYSKTGFNISAMNSLNEGNMFGDVFTHFEGPGKIRKAQKALDRAVIHYGHGLLFNAHYAGTFASTVNVESTRAAAAEGLTGAEAKTRASEIAKEAMTIGTNDPVASEIRAKAQQDAMRVTNTNDTLGSRLGKHVKDALNKTIPGAHLGDMTIPFSKIPGTLVSNAIEVSGGGLFKGAYQFKKAITEAKANGTKPDFIPAIKTMVRTAGGMAIATLIGSQISRQNYDEKKKMIRFGGENGIWVSTELMGPIGPAINGILEARFAKPDEYKLEKGGKGLLEGMKNLPGVRELGELYEYGPKAFARNFVSGRVPGLYKDIRNAYLSAEAPGTATQKTGSAALAIAGASKVQTSDQKARGTAPAVPDSVTKKLPPWLNDILGKKKKYNANDYLIK